MDVKVRHRAILMYNFAKYFRDPYVYSDEDNEDTIPPMKVDIDLSHSAYANSRK